MKTNTLRMAALAAVLLSVAACDQLDGSGGGLPGGNGLPSFQRGFVFIRPDDRNVYVSDQSDFSLVAQLTTSGDARSPSVSRDGRQVVFVSGSGFGSALQTVPVAGGTPTTVLAADSTHQSFAGPVFSPDGTKIAFSFVKGSASFIGMVNADGSGFLELAGGSPSMTSPTFYPDGLSLLVAAGTGTTGFGQLKKVNIATGADESVLDSLGAEAMNIQNRVAIDPSGTLAAFDGQVASSASRIFVVNLATSSVTQLTDHPEDPAALDSFPSWNGSTQVTFSSNSGGGDQIYGISPSAVKQSGSLQLPSAIEAWFGPN